MLQAMVYEAPPVVLLLVQPHDQADARVAEDGHIVLWSEGREPVGVGGGWAGPSEGQELVRHDPIHIPVLHLFEEVVRLHIELLPVEPSALDGFLHSLRTVQDCEAVGANPTCGVSEGQEGWIHRGKRFVGLICALTQDDHLKAAHQRGSVGALLGVMGAVVHDALVTQPGICQLRLQCLAKPPDHRQVQRTEVCKEGLVDEVMVHCKEVGLYAGSRRRM
mmetsp:Transcript_118459/g.281224  ORF Transcript_118459/g.281224 Transcript_118459/m.281224 type:complete len:220 (-) Transcript_118459:115-774(-)